MRPLIGIPQCLDDRGRWKPQRSYLYIDSAYSRAVEEAGGIPLHLPVQRDADELIARVDGLLIPGGDDFPPPHEYPEGVRFEPVPQAQLAFDRSLADAALQRSTPILGICYGMQLLALQCGASLHYHLPTDLPDATAHQLPESPESSRPESCHTILVGPGTRLSRLIGEGEQRVNSRHHQALASPGEGMMVSARAPDGVIEAIEAEDERFCVGVQWHPETLAIDARGPLFRALVEASRTPRV